MNRKEFVELFKSRLSEGRSNYAVTPPLLLNRAINSGEVAPENQMHIKGQFAIKLIIAGVPLADSLAALQAFDEIVEKFVLCENEGKKQKMKI